MDNAKESCEDALRKGEDETKSIHDYLDDVASARRKVKSDKEECLRQIEQQVKKAIKLIKQHGKQLDEVSVSRMWIKRTQKIKKL